MYIDRLTPITITPIEAVPYGCSSRILNFIEEYNIKASDLLVDVKLDYLILNRIPSFQLLGI